MNCTCKNCKFAKEHEDGLVCTEKLCFVKEEDACLDWDNDEYFIAPKWLIYLIVAIGSAFLFTNIL